MKIDKGNLEIAGIITLMVLIVVGILILLVSTFSVVG